MRPGTFSEHVELGENVRFVSDQNDDHVNYQVGFRSGVQCRKPTHNLFAHSAA